MTNQMKLKQAAILVMGLLPLGIMAQANKPQTPATPLPPPNNLRMMPSAPSAPAAEMAEKGKLSYAIGMNIGTGLKRQEISVDVDTLATAIKDVLSGNTTRLTDKDCTDLFNQARGVS